MSTSEKQKEQQLFTKHQDLVKTISGYVKHMEYMKKEKSIVQWIWRGDLLLPSPINYEGIHALEANKQIMKVGVCLMRNAITLLRLKTPKNLRKQDFLRILLPKDWIKFSFCPFLFVFGLRCGIR